MAENKTVKSGLLTVWRHLHVERDHMAAPLPADPAVGRPAEPFLGAGVGGASGGDDGADDVAPDGEVADPSIDWMQTIYRKAYIEVVDDVANLNGHKSMPFVYNFGDGENIGVDNTKAMLTIQDIVSSEMFWSTQIVGAYEPSIGFDYDSHLGEGGVRPAIFNPYYVLGMTPASNPLGSDPAKSRPSVVYTEVVRDLAAAMAAQAGAVGGGGAAATVISKDTLMGRITAHESLHPWGLDHVLNAPGGTGGPNDPNTVGVLRLQPNNLQGVDGDNMLEPVHIAKIRTKSYPR